VTKSTVFRSALSGLLILGVWTRANGQEQADLERAHELSDLGLAAFGVGRYADAIADFDAAYALSRVPLLVFNSAQAHRLKGDCEEAVTLYQRYIEVDPTAANRAVAEMHLSNMQQCVRARVAPTPAPAPQTRVELSPLPAQRPPPPRTRRPWFWGVIGSSAAVVATGITLGIVFGSVRNPVPSNGYIKAN
jgi:tetratricopeptide (TPR) repeat protein